MKINRLLIIPAAALAFTTGLNATLMTPSFRGNEDTLYSGFNIFTDAYTAVGNIGTMGEGNAPDVAGSTGNDIVYQTLAPGAFLTGGGNIYSAAGPSGFQITGSAGFDIETIVFQTVSLGTEWDYSSIVLQVGGISYAPDFTEELARVASGGFGGTTVTWAAQWDLSSLDDVTSYSIFANASGAHLSLDRIAIDSADSFSQVVAVPEPHEYGLALAAGALILAFARRRQTA